MGVFPTTDLSCSDYSGPNGLEKTFETIENLEHLTNISH